jgi:1,4-dihydroxy-2-naphthoate octaprenyltransferase
MSKRKALLGIIRAPFLILQPASVLLGLGTATWAIGQVNPFHLILALVGAVFANISVNVFNEYFDFKSGLDSRTRRTPFSGGSGTLPAEPEMAGFALTVAWITFAITALIGVYFLSVWGLDLLPLGILGLLIVLTYTNWATRSPFLCFITPGLGCGVAVVMGTHFVLTGQYDWTAFIAALVPTFLVSNLLLLNQFPDVEADSSVGRKHYPITIGKRKSGWIYIAFLIMAYAAIIYGVVAEYFPSASLLGLLTLVLGVQIIRSVLLHNEDIEKLIPALGMNVIVTILTPVLIAVGLFIG